jgi:glycosyltransferase involved in cell wall biosynthesis
MQHVEMPGRVPLSEVSYVSASSSSLMISIVIPVMNEKQNVWLLYEKIAAKLDPMRTRYEVIFVDDGSTDGTFNELQTLHSKHPDRVSVVRFRRNFGKTPALVAGFSRCRGNVVFTMDGDLQDDPEEIPSFLAKLDEGYDLVTGWKFPRLDPLSKTFPSRVFNGLVSTLTKLDLHDINCGFKAYRREVIEDMHLKLYGEFHRFIPVIAHWRGFRVAEIKVQHHPRTFGISKFGAKRFARGLIDLLTVLFLTSFLHTPLRLFGKLGFWTFLSGTLVDIFVVIRSLLIGEPIHNQPLLFVGILLIIFGFQFLLIGLLAEMIRYYAFRAGEEYSISQEIERRTDPHAASEPALREAPVQQESQQKEEQWLFPQLSQEWRWQQARPLWNQRKASEALAQGGSIPHRPTMIPL